MAGSYNHVTLVGRLTKDPEIKYVASGNAVTSFSLAVNRRTKQGEEAMFVDIVAWDSPGRKLAEICNTYLKKGMTVLIDGRLSIRSYETKEGDKRKATEIVANDMQMLDSKNSAGGGSYNGGGGAAPGASRPAGGGGSFDDETMDDEVRSDVVSEETGLKVLALLDVLATEVASGRADMRALDVKVTTLDRKVMALDTKVERLDQRLGRVETRVEGLETDL